MRNGWRVLTQEREKQLVGFRAWVDEYKAFKEICRELRTTPTAQLNAMMREFILEHKTGQAEEK